MFLADLCPAVDRSAMDTYRFGAAAPYIPSPIFTAPPTTIHLPEPGTLLNLKLQRTLSSIEALPAAVLSPVFRGFVHSPFASLSASPASALDDDGRGHLAQILGIGASTSLSSLCIIRGNDSPGAGIRWSSNDGLGFYVQGRPFMQLKRLMDSKSANICPPGDTSAMCREVPRKMCE